MSDRPRISLSTVVLDTPDPRSLAAFYRDLLGWTIGADEPDWVTVRPPDGGTGLGFQREPDHVPPVWPAGGDDQQMQVHLDVEVTDLARGVSLAQSLGATLAAHQPQPDIRVMIDPAGHLFCLWTE